MNPQFSTQFYRRDLKGVEMLKINFSLINSLCVLVDIILC